MSPITFDKPIELVMLTSRWIDEDDNIVIDVANFVNGELMYSAAAWKEENASLKNYLTVHKITPVLEFFNIPYTKSFRHLKQDKIPNCEPIIERRLEDMETLEGFGIDEHGDFRDKNGQKV